MRYDFKCKIRGVTMFGGSCPTLKEALDSAAHYLHQYVEEVNEDDDFEFSIKSKKEVRS